MVHRFITLLALLTLAPWCIVRADLFSEARQALRMQEPRLDSTGVTVRGGINLSTGQQPNSVTLLRAQARVNGGCGGFDFGASIKQAFDELPDLFFGLIGAAISELPMLGLCYASPTLCDLAKHWQGISNLAIQARYGQCQQMQAAAAYAGLRLRGGETSHCLEEQVNAGADISTAMRICNGKDTDSVRSPLGDARVRTELIGEVLEAAGASPEVRKLAGMLGTITLTAHGPGGLGHEQQRRPGAFLGRYEEHRTAAGLALREAIDEYLATGDVSDATLRAVSVPGQPIPRAAIEALAVLEKDPVRYQAQVGKVTTGLAVTQLTWECHELQEALAQATASNSHLTDEARRILEQRVQSVSQELANVIQKATVVQQYLTPAMTELLQEYTAVQSVATQAGLRAPSVRLPQTPFGGQLPAGYRQ